MATSPPWPRGAQHLIRWHLAMFGVGFGILGASQVIAPSRWDTAIYHITYHLAPRPIWGLVFVAVGAFKLAAAARYPRLALPALAAGSIIIGWWAASFTIATFTDPRFPPTGAVAWLWLLGGHFGVASLFDRRRGDRDGLSC